MSSKAHPVGITAQARSLHSTPGEAAEVQAETAAARVMRGGRAAVSTSGANSVRHRIMRRAISGRSALPAMTINPPAPRPGGKETAASKAVDAKKQSMPSPEMNAAISPAGAQPTAPAGADPQPKIVRPPTPEGKPGKPRIEAPEPKVQTPDQAQTPQAEPAPSPTDAMVAGSSAGAKTEQAEAKKREAGKEDDKKNKEEDKKGKKEEEDKDKKRDEDKKKKDKGKKKKKKKKKKRNFGSNLGDRGAPAAAEAQKRLDARATGMKHHEPAEKRVGDAQKAAVPPAKEGASRSEGDKVKDVCGTKPPAPKPESTKKELRGAVEDAAPDDIEDVVDMDAGALGKINGRVGGEVGGQVTGVSGTLDKVNKPDEPKKMPEAVPQPEPEPAAETAAPDLAAATPPEVPDKSLDATEFSDDADEALDQAGIDDDSLEKSKDGPLTEVRGNRENVQKSVDASKGKARNKEGASNEEAKGGLQESESTSDGGMKETRETEQKNVLGEQDKTKKGDETERQSVTEKIQGMYTAAAKKVNEKVKGLTGKAMETFDKGQKKLLDKFKKETRSDMRRFKRRRYGGILGPAKWLKDKLLGLNDLPAVKRIYKSNRDGFIKNIDALIKTISDNTDTVITECKTILCDAKKAIQDFVDTLPKDLKKEAEAAQERVNKQFAALETAIQETANQTKKQLQSKRKQAIKAVDKALDEIKAENEGLIGKLIALIKAILNFLGKFLELVVAVTKMGIGSFIGAALSQAKAGIRDHLWDQLKAAFKEWLFAKFAFIEPILNLAGNWFEIVSKFFTGLPQMFAKVITENVPQVAAAAMTWLATALAAKLIPGAGAIMAVIDAIRAAWDLIQQLVKAASAFFQFLIKVAKGGFGAVDFAKALAHGIIAGLAALLTFLGFDRLIERVVGAILKPFGKLFKSLSAKFKKDKGAKAKKAKQEKTREKKEPKKEGKEKKDKQKEKKKEKKELKKQKKDALKAKQKKADKGAAKTKKADHKKKDKKDKEKDKKKKDDDKKKDKKEKDKRKRTKRAAKAFKAYMRSAKTFRAAKQKARGIARDNKVKVRFSKSKGAATAVFHGSPGSKVPLKPKAKGSKTAKKAKAATGKAKSAKGGLPAKKQKATRKRKARFNANHRNKLRDVVAGRLTGKAARNARSDAKVFIKPQAPKDLIASDLRLWKAALATKDTAADSGAAGRDRETTRKEQIAQEDRTRTMLPTRTEGIEEGAGMDAARLRKDEKALELIEIKKGDVAVFKAGGTTPATPDSPRQDLAKGKTPFGVTKGDDQAAADRRKQALAGDKFTTPKDAGGTRDWENQLSAITANLTQNIKDIYELVKAAAKSAGAESADAKTKQRLEDILTGEGGVIRVIVDMDKAKSFPPEQQKLANKLISEAFATLGDKLKLTITAKLEMVVRKVDDTKDDDIGEDTTLLS